MSNPAIDRPPQDPHALLGVSAKASLDEIRRAYVEKIRQFPPDRAPEMFEKIRDAYQELHNPKRRAASLLECPHSPETLEALADAFPRSRQFVGAGPWLAVLKEK